LDLFNPSPAKIPGQGNLLRRLSLSLPLFAGLLQAATDDDRTSIEIFSSYYYDQSLGKSQLFLEHIHLSIKKYFKTAILIYTHLIISIHFQFSNLYVHVL